MRTPLQHLRNRSVTATLVMYALANGVGLLFGHTSNRFLWQYGLQVVCAFCIFGLATAVLYIVSCWFGARSRGYSGWIGIVVAAIGLAVWFGLGFVLTYQNVNHPLSPDNPAGPGNIRTLVLPWSAALLATAIICALPDRGAAAPEARAQAHAKGAR